MVVDVGAGIGPGGGGGERRESDAAGLANLSGLEALDF